MEFHHVFKIDFSYTIQIFWDKNLHKLSVYENKTL